MEFTEHPTDILLLAYVDGELDLNQRHAVEDLLAHDMAACQRVAQFQDLNRLLKEAFPEGSTVA
ncbi:hypothetical protein SAE02_75270 [Skermanella aerolata]|uniref:Zinc-finger domain-containing protein n=1 Tax=Skermanella aerolata TaxID=393310 RepID=A0A512E3W7_9PROT|nr:hypothetical protein [Skermanella aerolata]KJB90239.1 hypothetical protein N826_04515 [Skermanella aerolata KACC 11604]GEO43379.1 hypothetical protein SAE02_75270 [Skermanella aerolata]